LSASASGVRIHDLRHTAALTIQAGHPPKMLQKTLGHASITTKPDLYGHLYPATWPSEALTGSGEGL